MNAAVAPTRPGLCRRRCTRSYTLTIGTMDGNIIAPIITTHAVT